MIPWVHDSQREAAMREFFEALEEGNIARATRIGHANPDVLELCSPLLDRLGVVLRNLKEESGQPEWRASVKY